MAVEEAQLRSPTLVLIGAVVSLLDNGAAAAAAATAALAAEAADGNGVAAWQAEDLLRVVRAGEEANEANANANALEQQQVRSQPPPYD